MRTVSSTFEQFTLGIEEEFQIVDPHTRELRSRKEIRHIRTILERGTSADEQLRVWREKGNLKAVVDRLIEMTLENVPRELITKAVAVV